MTYNRISSVKHTRDISVLQNEISVLEQNVARLTGEMQLQEKTMKNYDSYMKKLVETMMRLKPIVYYDSSIKTMLTHPSGGSHDIAVCYANRRGWFPESRDGSGGSPIVQIYEDSQNWHIKHSRVVDMVRNDAARQMIEAYANLEYTKKVYDKAKEVRDICAVKISELQNAIHLKKMANHQT
jgi:hypothetical protein